jgi:hypothetical protein
MQAEGQPHPYIVTLSPLACSCPGFANHGHCKHSDFLAAFLRGLCPIAEREQAASLAQAELEANQKLLDRVAALECSLAIRERQLAQAADEEAVLLERLGQLEGVANRIENGYETPALAPAPGPLVVGEEVLWEKSRGPAERATLEAIDTDFGTGRIRRANGRRQSVELSRLTYAGPF